MQDDFRAEQAAALRFYSRRSHRHDDGYGDAQKPAVPR